MLLSSRLDGDERIRENGSGAQEGVAEDEAEI